ncbi:MAG TPA: carboxymuconolactone decarboxylase family protein, partial [Albitalea sp.]|nr:carboxymuconolactone decarboxylase family protein [Albitalea sp.]
MDHPMYPDVSKELAQQRRELAPETYAAFRGFGHRAFADGALPAKTKELIAVAAAHVTQCPYCIRSHTKLAMAQGATEAELME